MVASWWVVYVVLLWLNLNSSKNKVPKSLYLVCKLIFFYVLVPKKQCTVLDPYGDIMRLRSLRYLAGLRERSATRGYVNDPVLRTAVRNFGQCAQAWPSEMMVLMKTMVVVKAQRGETKWDKPRWEAMANTCASSRGNTWVASVIRLDWAYSVVRRLKNTLGTQRGVLET